MPTRAETAVIYLWLDDFLWRIECDLARKEQAAASALLVAT